MMYSPVSTLTGVRLEDFDLDREDWRASFAWPVPFEDLFAISHRLQRRFVDLLAALDGDERNVMTLARLLTGTAITLEMALAVQAERASGLRLIGPPELDVLRGAPLPEGGNESSLVDMGARVSARRIRLRTMRRFLRILSWTSPVRLLAALSAPHAVAVTHNPLLVTQARRTRTRLGFRHAAPLLERVMRSAPGVSLLDRAGQIGAVADRALERLTDDPALTDDSRQRTIELLRPVYAGKLAQAARALGALRAAKRLPSALWSGTGGSWPACALGIEVRRRGGAVIRFDHGGVLSLLAEPYFLVHRELVPSTSYVLPSALAARQKVVTRAAELARPLGFASIMGGVGDPALDPGPPSIRSAARRPRVLFVGTAFYGLSQTCPPRPPAPVYLDWQHRVLDILRSFPVELIHKPHPGGLFLGRPPGLDHLARIDPRPFEVAMADIDCFVFDFAASTTFSVALSTGRRIVLLDFGGVRFSDEMRPLIEARCRVVPIVRDDRNRATVDAEALETAVCDPSPAPDPTPFRRHFLAEGGGGS